MSYILECSALSKSYGGMPALLDVSLSLSEGRIVGLLGPNGSGKTTLLKLCCGLLTPNSGTILIDGTPVGAESKALVSFLPDREFIPKKSTPKAAMAEFADFYADFDPARAQSILSDMGIDTSSRMVSLSKGNREKVHLALCMARRARLYLLDEPISGVDPAARDYIINTVLTNYNPSACVVISTHLIADVEHILNDVVFLSRGSVKLFGEAEQLRSEHEKSIDELFREVYADVR